MGEHDDALGKPFAIELEDDEGTRVVKLFGAFGGESRAGLEEQIKAVIAAAPRRVALDLRGLTFIDSTGLNMVLNADSLIRESGIAVVVIRGKGQVRRLLEITGAERALTLVDDLADAPASP